MTSFPVRARLLLVAPTLVLLTACNPLSAPVPADVPVVSAHYAGPSGAWLEVAVFGSEGFDVTYQVTVVHFAPGARLCRDASTGEVEPCEGSTDVLHTSDVYSATLIFRATVSPVENDLLAVGFSCRQGGATVACPPSLRTTLRVVDDDGTLVGDLRP